MELPVPSRQGSDMTAVPVPRGTAGREADVEDNARAPNEEKWMFGCARSGTIKGRRLRHRRLRALRRRWRHDGRGTQGREGSSRAAVGGEEATDAGVGRCEDEDASLSEDVTRAGWGLLIMLVGERERGEGVGRIGRRGRPQPGA